MLLRSTRIARADFERETGWQFKPEGACKGSVCIPLPDGQQGETLDVPAIAAAMGLPLVKADDRELWALGPESIGARALTSAAAPDFELPDIDGNHFRLSSLRGEKVLLYAWAPY